MSNEQEELLTKEERMQLQGVREDYLEIFYTKPELREDDPEFWHTVVDQWELVNAHLEKDEWARIRSTCHTVIDEEDYDND
tara:strand:+ start:503 stop:745 length:243 start_codon:yes stop_codon:yes gene_type:complete